MYHTCQKCKFYLKILILFKNFQISRCNQNTFTVLQIFWKRRSGFRCISTVAFLLFLRGSLTLRGQFPNPTGVLSKATVKIRRDPLLHFHIMIPDILFKFLLACCAASLLLDVITLYGWFAEKKMRNVIFVTSFTL